MTRAQARSIVKLDILNFGRNNKNYQTIEVVPKERYSQEKLDTSFYQKKNYDNRILMWLSSVCIFLDVLNVA